MENSERLIEFIRQKEIKPIPRWKFTLKYTAITVIFAFCILTGALAFSVILFAVQQVDFNVVSHLTHSWFELLLGLMPIFWIVALMTFLVSAVFTIKSSRKGYKFTSPKLTGITVSMSILLGTLFFITGGAKWLENVFTSNVGIYNSIQDKKEAFWSAPDEGRLSGIVLNVDSTGPEIKDFNGKTWKIIFDKTDGLSEHLLIPANEIKLVGRKLSENSFRAEQIRPWGGMRYMHRWGRKGKN